MLAGDAADDVLDIRRSLEHPPEFAPVFDRHFDAVHRYLHRRAGRELADELAAETFLIAFEQRARFVGRDGLGVRPWLYGIATNLLRRRWRVERRQLLAYARSGIDAATLLDTDASVSRADASRRGAQLAAALARLRPDDRDAFLLITLTGLTYSEAAAALELAPGTVATRVRRARELLARELAPVEVPTRERLADA
jgi:RNA polymerase sigma factor (sigma-70 family)